MKRSASREKNIWFVAYTSFPAVVSACREVFGWEEEESICQNCGKYFKESLNSEDACGTHLLDLQLISEDGERVSLGKLSREEVIAKVKRKKIPLSKLRWRCCDKQVFSPCALKGKHVREDKK